jgi:hypothetical protein
VAHNADRQRAGKAESESNEGGITGDAMGDGPEATVSNDSTRFLPLVSWGCDGLRATEPVLVFACCES